MSSRYVSIVSVFPGKREKQSPYSFEYFKSKDLIYSYVHYIHSITHCMPKLSIPFFMSVNNHNKLYI